MCRPERVDRPTGVASLLLRWLPPPCRRVVLEPRHDRPEGLMFGKRYQPARGPRFSRRPLPVVAYHSGEGRYVGRAFSAWGARRLAERDLPRGSPNHHATVGLADAGLAGRDPPRHWRWERRG